MVDQDTLCALDAIEWLTTEAESLNKLGITPAKFKRNLKKCLKIFNLELEEIQHEWHTIGDKTILLMERQVHQTARWLGHRRLRYEATYWSKSLFHTSLSSRWLAGLCTISSMPRMFKLTRERIVDVCLTTFSDIPSPDDPDLTSHHLARMPIFFTAKRGHPLVGIADITYKDIATYPTLTIPAGAHPTLEKSLKSIGLWNDATRLNLQQRELWQGKTEEELTIGYATALSMKVCGGDQVRLPLNLPLISLEAIVFHREFAANPELLRLKKLIQEYICKFAIEDPEICLIN